MLVKYFKSLIIQNREFILKEVLEVRGLMQLLMKHQNTGQKWTRAELKKIKSHLSELAKVIPVLIIFLLPGGSLFLPFLTQVIDRRNTPRT